MTLSHNFGAQAQGESLRINSGALAYLAHRPSLNPVTLRIPLRGCLAYGLVLKTTDILR
jgi:hypothetical protein